LESDVPTFVAQDSAAKGAQNGVLRRATEGQVVDPSHQLRRQEYREHQFQSDQVPEPAKDAVRPLAAEQSSLFPLQIVRQQLGVPLFLLDKQPQRFQIMPVARSLAVFLGRSQQAASAPTLTELKNSD
jgi:hypothetical protein